MLLIGSPYPRNLFTAHRSTSSPQKYKEIDSLDSLIVTDSTTNRPAAGLNALSGREALFSCSYGRFRNNLAVLKNISYSQRLRSLFRGSLSNPLIPSVHLRSFSVLPFWPPRFRIRSSVSMAHQLYCICSPKLAPFSGSLGHGNPDSSHLQVYLRFEQASFLGSMF